MKACFLFPGQGAQYPGMGKDLWEESSKVKTLFELAADITKMDLKKLLFEGTEEDLKATDKTQIAITLVNLSASTVLKDRGIETCSTAGFSLGEYAALAEAGVISLTDLFAIVKARGEAMEKASRALDAPSGNPGMSAVIGLEYDKVIYSLQQVKGAFLANYNSPSQVVIAGTAQGLQDAEQVLKDAGARRIISLKVSGPFHSPLLEAASIKLAEVIAPYTFNNPKLPVYSNVTGKKISTGQEAKELCVKQVINTVKWVEVEKSLLADGNTKFLEVGPGAVLAGLWKAFNSEYTCLPAGTLETITKIN